MNLLRYVDYTHKLFRSGLSRKQGNQQILVFLFCQPSNMKDLDWMVIQGTTWTSSNTKDLYKCGKMQNMPIFECTVYLAARK